jgi:hypothetical protein
MFGSAIVDVLLAVIFTFLAISLAASALTEATASVLKLRQGTLLRGVKALLNDPNFTGLAKVLYGHALVNPLAVGNESRIRPAYIAPEHFALALTDVLRTKNAGKPLGDVVGEIADPQLRQALQALWTEAAGDTARFQAAVGRWFDSAMDRLAGWYKRKTQLISFVFAYGCAAALNADPLRVTTLVWARPALANGLGAIAASKDTSQVNTAIALLDAGNLIGWAGWATDPRNTMSGIAAMFLGWGIVAGASLFGAAFWFDALQRIAAIRGTGSPIGSMASGGER